MRRLVVVLIGLSDWLCWLVIFLSVLWAVVTPVTNLTFWPRLGQDVPLVPLLLVSAAPLLVAAGAFAVLKRRLLGLIPLFFPALGLFAIGAPLAGVVVACVVAALFVLPYAIVFFAGPRANGPTGG